jgi:hypothetical protein
MRSGRSFLLLLLVAAGLGGYIYFVEMPRDPLADTATTREKVFADLTPGAITEIEVTNAAADTTRVVRTDAEWALTAPVETAADTVEVSTVVSSIESLEQTRVVAETADNAAAFGLSPARIRVTFKTADGAPRTLLIGTKTPTGSDLYASVDGSPTVFLIGGYLETTFDKSPFDFRDKSALKFTRDAADAITIVDGASRLGFTRSGSDWRLSAPVDARADVAAVDGLISRLFQARMVRLATDDGTRTLREYGLDRPSLTVTVGSGSSSASLAIGKADGEAAFFARDLSRPLVFTVEKTLVDELRKSPDDVRVKDIFEFRSFSAATYSITVGGTTYTFAKGPGEGENAADIWSMTAPGTKAVEAAKMTDLLTTTSNLRAESFAARAFTTGDVVAVTATFGDGEDTKTETATFRRSGEVVHGIRDGEPGAAVVSTVDFDRVLTLLKDIAGS